MRFGSVPLSEAEGAILAHSLGLKAGRMRKGRVLTAADLAALAEAGVTQVTVARLGPDDVPEDEAARALAEALVPDPGAAGLTLAKPFTGRVNLNATGPGVVELDAGAVGRLNGIDPTITFATLAPMTRVAKGMLVGTVKIIAYGVARQALEAACNTARSAVRIRPVARRSAGLILTRVPGQDERLARKGEEAVAQRLEALGMELADTALVAHETGAIAAALGRLKGEIALILTGSATSDLNDTAPEAVRRAGGRIERFGMPVDPGNLLFLGEAEGRPVIGLPGCARSPALNGADWVLERVACGLEVSAEDIAAMGVGGLLKEIPIRPQPRERRK
jgi:molybdenum cofactor cytidylyltransferase